MAVLGIVAEFNPFHNGHLHLVEEALKKENFSAAVCVMSGNFLQRGEPALCDKWSRAEMAVRCGLDLVIELPFCFAVRSAWYFARGAVNLLAQTGVVTHLAFGSESGDINGLNAVASVLASEPDEFKNNLRSQLNKGLNYPAARSLALQDYLSSTPDLEHLLMGPNNILGIEYLRVIIENCLPLIPLTIPRQGNYHDPSLDYFSSATAIRKSLEQNQSLQLVATAMPKACLERLEKDIFVGRAPVHTDALEQAVFFQLRSRSTAQLQTIYEVNEGLENRLHNAAITSHTLEELRHRVKSKRYSLTRINRTLLYSLLALSKTQMQVFDLNGPQYIHVLAFSAKGQEILQEMKIKCTLPVLSRGSDVKQAYMGVFGRQVQDMIAVDVLADDLYVLGFPNPQHRQGAQAFTSTPFILSD